MAVAWIPWCWPKDSVSATSAAVTLAPWGGYISHVQCADDLLSSGSSAPGEPTLAPQIQPLLDHTLALDKSLGRSKSGKDREHPEGRSLE
jgi:hypothetical protein